MSFLGLEGKLNKIVPCLRCGSFLGFELMVRQAKIVLMHSYVLAVFSIYLTDETMLLKFNEQMK